MANPLTSSSQVHCEVIQALEDSGAVVNTFVICLDQPGREHNVIDRALGLQLARAVYLAAEKVEAGEIDLVVVCSGKKGSFVAGADIQSEMKYVGVEGEQNAYRDIRMLQNIFCSLESLSVPTVAVMNGIALGGGLELALACDFRIADSIHCKQIGLPEVKIGVLPGAGGCVRLPRLLGLRRSIGLIVSGESINGQKALKLGIVDHLSEKTQSTSSTSGDSGGGSSYKYEWLSCVLNCVDQKRIGNKQLLIRKRDGATAVSAVVGGERCLEELSEEGMMSSLAENWEECERKAEMKYPLRPEKPFFLRSSFEFVTSVLVYTMTLFQLWRKVGFKMPAPYASLQTVFRCYYSGSWLEAMSLNAQALSCLIVTPESKALMFLFLVTRKLKKIALHFGLKPNEKTAGFDSRSTSILVLLSKEYLSLTSSFIQGLLYNKISTTLLLTGKGLEKSKVVGSIKAHFRYALKRGYISQHEVEERMGLFTCSDGSGGGGGLSSLLQGGGRDCLVVMSASSEDCALQEVTKEYQKVISVSLFPNVSTISSSSIPYPLLMNVGDPQRKNTLTVEITPLTHQTPPEDLRMMSSLVSAMGKTPVLTPPTSLPSSGLHLLLSHWSFAVSLVSVYKGNITAKKIDQALLAMGYGTGPFQAMDKFGKAYIPGQQDWKNNNIHFSRLRKYLETGTIPSTNRKKNLVLTDEQIFDLFTLNLALTSLHACSVTKGLNEATIDVIAVSGLVRFPPTEAGPLNFITRLGTRGMLQMYRDCVKLVPFLVDVSGTKNIRISSFESQFLALYEECPEDKTLASQSEDAGLIELFQSHRSEVILLNHKELQMLGECGGLKNREIFLLPLTAGLCVVMSVGVLLMFSLVVFLYMALLQLVLVQ